MEHMRADAGSGYLVSRWPALTLSAAWRKTWADLACVSRAGKAAVVGYWFYGVDSTGVCGGSTAIDHIVAENETKVCLVHSVPPLLLI